MQRGLNVIAILLLVALSIVNLAFMEHNKRLQEQRDLMVNKRISSGDILRGFSGVDLAGNLVSVDVDALDRSMVLIAYSAGCPACQASLSNMIKLTNTLDRNHWRVLWLSLDKNSVARAYFGSKGIEDEVLGEFSCRSYNELGLRSVPRIVVVGPGGKVEAAWEGRFTERLWDEIFQYFATRQDRERKLAAIP